MAGREHEKHDNEESPLEHFNSGGVTIVEFPDGRLKVVLQKLEGSVRAGIVGTGGMSGSEFDALVSSLGGTNAIIRTALNQIGVTQEIEKGSGVLKNYAHDAPVSDFLKNFRFGRKK